VFLAPIAARSIQFRLSGRGLTTTLIKNEVTPLSRPGRGTDPPTPSSAEGPKKGYSYTYTHPKGLRGL